MFLRKGSIEMEFSERVAISIFYTPQQIIVIAKCSCLGWRNIVFNIAFDICQIYLRLATTYQCDRVRWNISKSLLSLQWRPMSVMASQINSHSTVCLQFNRDNFEESIKDPHYWPLERGYTGHRWIHLTHWGRVMHICVSKLTIIGSDNGFSPERRQANIWANAGILLIGTLGTNFSEILIGIQTFSFKKLHLKTSSAKWRLFCFGLNELTRGQ